MPTVQRALAYLWAFPNTLLGLVLIGLTLPLGTRARWHSGVLEAEGAPISWLLRRIPFFAGALALALGHVVLARSPLDHDTCRRHERIHVRQYERWGPFFLPAYIFLALRAHLRGGRAYRDNPFERAAYESSSQDRFN